MKRTFGASDDRKVKKVAIAESKDDKSDFHDGKSEAGEEEIPVFVCKLDTTEDLVNILATILIEKDQVVVCTITNQGLKFTVTKGKSLRAKAYLKRGMFLEYQFVHSPQQQQLGGGGGGDDEDETVDFTLNLSLLLDCLQVFGGSSHLQLTYQGYGSPVSLLLEEGGVITQCEIATLEPPAPVQFNFRDSPIVNRAAVRSKLLRDCFVELELPGAQRVVVSISPQAPHLSMSVKGDLSSCKVDFPMEEDKDVFTQFECQNPMNISYSLNLIRPCIKALAKAEHTNLRINQQGMLSLQHIVPTRDSSNSGNWVEFLIVAVQDE